MTPRSMVPPPHGRAPDVRRTPPVGFLGPLLGLVAHLGCGSSASVAEAVGELGNGTFEYRCGSGTDPACVSGLPRSFPDCLIVGGRFEIGYTLRDGDGLREWDRDFVYVKPASPAYFGGLDTLTALKVGRAAVVAYAGESVVDILHVPIVAHEAVRLRDDAGGRIGAEVTVALGQTVIVRAYGESAACDLAGGGIPITSVSDDPAIAAVSGLDSVQVTGVALGTTTVTVTMGALSEPMTVVVVPVGDGSDTQAPGTSGGDESTDSATGAGDASTSGSSDGSDSESSDGSDSESSGPSESSGTSDGSSAEMGD